MVSFVLGTLKFSKESILHTHLEEGNQDSELPEFTVFAEDELNCMLFFSVSLDSRRHLQ